MVLKVGQIDDRGRRFAGWRVRVYRGDRLTWACGIYETLESAQHDGRAVIVSLRNDRLEIIRVWIKESAIKQALRRCVHAMKYLAGGTELYAYKDAVRLLRGDT